MPLECELKYIGVDLDVLDRKLQVVNAKFCGRYFESNLVYDKPGRVLKESGVLLRLREKAGVAVLTVKKPPNEPVSQAVKVFEEIETGVTDHAAMKSALEAIGFDVAFAYEKVRAKWKYLNCTLCLDMLPYGDFVELEGDEDSIFSCAAELGLNEYETTTKTYHALNIEYRERMGMEPDESFVFSSGERERLLEEIGKE